MILPILKFPDKGNLLRTKANQVKFPLDVPTKLLIRDMFETVVAAKGIGLAAPQVGKSLRIIVLDLSHNGIPPFVLINPRVTKFSKNETELEEGCLSIPGVYGYVPRPEKITVTADTMDGKQISAEVDELMSKAIQHEIDHLDGILIIDKITKYTAQGGKEGTERTEKLHAARAEKDLVAKSETQKSKNSKLKKK